MREITFLVTEDEADGGYTAKAHWPPGSRDIFTDGDTRGDLLRNIRDAIDAAFAGSESKPTSVRLHFLRGSGHLRDRALRGDRERFVAALGRAPDADPAAGDRM